jgi:hypothetical protein
MVSETIASLILLFGRLIAPLTYKLVEDTLVNVPSTALKLVAKAFVDVLFVVERFVIVAPTKLDEFANKFVVVTDVPERVRNVTPPFNVPPLRGK